MRKPLIAGNWKMNHNQLATRAWCRRFRDIAREDGRPPAADVELAIAPPFTSIPAFLAETGEEEISTGAQNLHQESSGAFTGELSAGMLVELPVDFVILGHSERRHVFGESDERISLKVAAARENQLLPYLCVGETEDERDSGRMEPTIEKQLQAGLSRISLGSADDLVIAYEPVWAIGTGRTATREQAQEAHGFLREILASICSSEIARGVRILYGGSVKANNAGDLAAMPDVDGFLVGGASLDAGSFLSIARAWSGND